jgi:hypothetical protein
VHASYFNLDCLLAGGKVVTVVLVEHSDSEVSTALVSQHVCAFTGEEVLLSVKSGVMVQTPYGAHTLLVVRTEGADVDDWKEVITVVLEFAVVAGEAGGAHAYVWGNALSAVLAWDLALGVFTVSSFITFNAHADILCDAGTLVKAGSTIKVSNFTVITRPSNWA